MRRACLLPILLLLSTISLFAEPIEIIPPELRGAVQPQVAVTPSGRIHLVFGRDSAIYHTTSADGRTFSAPVKIGELEKLALKMRRGPRVTATEKLILVTAISHADGNIHAWTSADRGATWKQSAAINSAPGSAREGMQGLAGDGRGLVAAVWLDMRNKGMELRGRVSRDGGSTWGEDTAIYASPDGHICECCPPNVAISPAGEIAVMWRNWLGGSRDLFKSTSSDGAVFSQAQKLGTGTWKLNACPMDGGSIAWSGKGHWLSVWRRERDIFASEAAKPERRIASNAIQPVVGFVGEKPLVLWEENGALLLQFDANSPVRFAPKATAASIASGPATAVIAWESSANGAKTILLDTVK